VKNGRACEKWSRIFTQDIWTRLSESNDKWKVLRENPSRNLYHPCNANEYLDVLKQLPDRDTEYVKAIVLRRTTKYDQRLGIDARIKYCCVLLNAFPKTNEMIWETKPKQSTLHHYKPWCNSWVEEGSDFILRWSKPEIKRYYLYHLFLHEIGHLNQPNYNSLKKREEFAENYALEWARKLKML